MLEGKSKLENNLRERLQSCVRQRDAVLFTSAK
jgi:hypothetical protein